MMVEGECICDTNAYGDLECACCGIEVECGGIRRE